MAVAVAEKRTVRTQGELASALDVTDRTVRHYLARGMPGCDSRGRYNVERCRGWISKNIRERETLDVSELKEAFVRAELAKTEEQAKKLKLANDILERQLVYRDEVLQSASEMVLRIKTRLEAFPAEVEMQLPNEVRADVKRELESQIFLLLKEMAGWEVTG